MGKIIGSSKKVTVTIPASYFEDVKRLVNAHLLRLVAESKQSESDKIQVSAALRHWRQVLKCMEEVETA